MPSTEFGHKRTVDVLKKRMLGGETMGKNYYDYVGEFIYSVRRHGGDLHDINNWMADDLGVARPPINDDSVQSNLYSDFVAKYSNEDEFRANLARFVETIKSRSAERLG